MQQARARQVVDAETKRLNALSAQLGRLCQPKPKSGKLDVPVEIYEQWKKAGEPRKILLSTLIAANGDKDPARKTAEQKPPNLPYDMWAGSLQEEDRVTAANVQEENHDCGGWVLL